MAQTILTKWYKEVKIKGTAHNIAARFWEICYNIIGFAAIFAGIIAGWEIATNVREGDQIEWWAIIIGSFSIIAAICNAAMKFFGLENRKQSHYLASSQYFSLQMELERQLLVPEKQIACDFFDQVSIKLSEIKSKAPLLSQKNLEKAKKQLKKMEPNELLDNHEYEIKLTEDWTYQDDDFVKIGKNPTRIYKCGISKLTFYQNSNEISIQIPIDMNREGKKYKCKIEAFGPLDKDVAFLNYTYYEIDMDIVTYGVMMLRFTNWVKAEGFWMAAEILGGNYIMGKINLMLTNENKKANDS